MKNFWNRRNKSFWGLHNHKRSMSWLFDYYSKIIWPLYYENQCHSSYFIVCGKVSKLYEKRNDLYLMTLKIRETTRDGGDCWLSLEYPPQTTVSDTACTFSANLSRTMHFIWTIKLMLLYYEVMREPEKAKLWCGDRLGGFEAPVPGKPPSRVHVPELKVWMILH